MENEENVNKLGVFEKVQVLKQLPVDESEFIFKRGGYFNVEKKKFIIKNSQQACVKFIA